VSADPPTRRELIEDQRGWLILGASREREELLHQLLNVAAAAERVDRLIDGDDHITGDFGAVSAALRDQHDRLEQLDQALRVWDAAHS
jgi:hypothetical protein